MKKRIFFILCLFLTLSVGKTIAAPSPEKEANPAVIMYSVNLGDITGLSEESIDAMLTEAFSNVPDCANEANCTATVSVKVKVGTSGTGIEAEVSVTIEAPCSEIVKEAKKVLAEMKKELT